MQILFLDVSSHISQTFIIGKSSKNFFNKVYCGITETNQNSKDSKMSPKIKEFRPKLFEFSRAFINSDICKFLDLFAAQFTFREMFLIASDKILLTFEYFFYYFEPFSQNEAVGLARETT